MSTAAPIDPAQARTIIEKHIASIPVLADAEVTPVPDLDVAGLRAFSVLPRLTGEAGEVIYLVGPHEMLTSGNPGDFDSLMARLGGGTAAAPFDVQRFAFLFLRLRVLRRGAVLESADGHSLLEPGQLPACRFSPPQVDVDHAGARYRFWVFDTDRMEPVFWDVRVAPGGATTFTSTSP
jgi:hypothetical protein